MFNTEILAPGGSFNSSIHAFESGADGIYAGMSSYSARKGAANFSLDSLRRLKGYAAEKGKKIYIAINTVIRQDEMEEVLVLLHRLQQIGVDAVILQDMGLSRIMEEYFPAMERHASTQMAVHNSRGVEFLKRRGFSRIILARELTLKEIRTIRDDHRDVELEVFIHGAMCYSFSGVCLASGRLLGRSGNRGECGQICRTWFDGAEKHRYAFSANDMKAGEAVLQLRDMGIDSLKIEGRLKSPAYVSRTVAYYRALLDGKDRVTVAREDDLSAVAFSRNQTSAFFTSPKGLDMVNNRYAAHTGIKAGTVLSSCNGKVRLKAETELSHRDGLLIFTGDDPLQFALKTQGGKSHYGKGEMVEFSPPRSVSPGTEVFLASRHDMTLKEFKEESFKPWKTPVRLMIELDENSLKISAPGLTGDEVYSVDAAPEKARGSAGFSELLEKTFRQSGDSSYRGGDIEFRNGTSLPDGEIFLPPPFLKQTRRDFYDFLETRAEEIFRKSAGDILYETDKKLEDLPLMPAPVPVPPRKDMTDGGHPIPFGLGKDNWFPLAPLQFSERDFMELEKEIGVQTEKGNPLILGLNNPAHFSLIETFRDRENVFFFTDYCLYGANRAAALFFREHSEKMLFSTYWIEDREGTLPPFRKIEGDFNPHLFVSRICYRLHNGLGSCGDCRKDYSWPLKQRDREFTVVVKDCLTWLFQKE